MIVLKNLAESFITSAISETATEITIPADHTDLFPSLFEGDNFRAALVNPATKATEFINVTARNGNVLTVVRGEEGVAALPFPVESRIHLRMTAKTWEEMAGECWMRPKDVSGEMVIPQFVDSNHFSLAGDYRDFFKRNRAMKAYPNLSVGFVESAVFADNITTVKVIEMTVPDTLSHIEAGLDPDALAKRTLSNEELLGYMTPVPVLTMEALEVDGGTLVHGTISHPEKGKVYTDSTEFNFSLPENVTDFELTGLNFKLRVPVITEENSPQSVGPITCRAAQMSLILSNSSNPITLSVRYVGIKAGVTLAYADTQSGYPNADVNNEGAKLPACTIGLNNPSGKLIVSGRPEFEIMGAELNLLEGTDENTIVIDEVIESGQEIVTEKGISKADTVANESTVTGPVAVFPAQSLSYSGGSNCGSYTDPTHLYINTSESYSCAPKGTAGTLIFILSKVHHGLKYIEFEGISSEIARTVDNCTVSVKKGEDAEWTHIADLNFTWNASKLKTTKDISQSVEFDQIKYEYKHTSADGDSFPVVFRSIAYVYENNIKFVVQLASSLSSVPTKVFKKPAVGATIGIGATDEPINQETELTLGEGSTISSIVLTSGTSIKDKIYTDASIHKSLKCDGQVVAVESVSEALVDSKFITTVNLTTPLAKIPTTVALPSCFTIPSAIESCTISGSALKFTGAKVDISDPAVKRLALKVVGDDSLRVKAAKIYTEEGA